MAFCIRAKRSGEHDGSFDVCVLAIQIQPIGLNTGQALSYVREFVGVRHVLVPMVQPSNKAFDPLGVVRLFACFVTELCFCCMTDALTNIPRLCFIYVCSSFSWAGWRCILSMYLFMFTFSASERTLRPSAISVHFFVTIFMHPY